MKDLSLKDQALLKLRESYDLLHKAGISESLQDLLYKEQWYSDFINSKEEDYVEFYNCAICNSRHNMSLSIKKDRSLQYSLSIEIETKYDNLSFFSKLKSLYRLAKCIFIKKRSVNDFLLSTQDLSSFKDLLKRLP